MEHVAEKCIVYTVYTVRSQHVGVLSLALQAFRIHATMLKEDFYLANYTVTFHAGGPAGTPYW